MADNPDPQNAAPTQANNPDPERIREAATAQAELNALLKEQNDILYDSEDTFGKLYEALGASAAVVRSGNDEEAHRRAIIRDSFSELRRTLNVVRELRDHEDGIKKLDANQLERKKEILKSNKNRLADLAKDLAISLKIYDTEKDKISLDASEILANKNLTKQQQELLIAYLHNFDAIDANINKTQEEIEHQERMNSALGTSGALLDNLERVGVRALGGLGLNLGVFKKGFEEALAAGNVEADEVAKAMAAEGKKTADPEDKLKVIAAMGPGLKKAIKEGLNDPLIVGGLILNSLVKNFNKVQKASVEVSRLTGQTSTGMATMQMRIASTADVLEVVGELTKQTGLNANNVFSEETLAAAAEFKNTLGLSADEAGKLAIISQATGTNIDSNLESIVDTVNQFNKANRSAVSQGIVLRDVAKVSDGISASLGGNPVAITAAAAAARKLGMELSNLDKIADSLMNFEDSIGKELEAQLLTGKDINLAKARELALNNDLAGLGEELFKNSADLYEYGEMNRIQQQSLAEALGMSRDELARMAYQTALNKGMTEEQAEAATKVTTEEMKRMTVQENLSKALEKVAQAITPIVEAFAMIVSSSTLFYSILVAVAAISLTRTIMSLKAMVFEFKKTAAFSMLTRLGLDGLKGIGAFLVGSLVIGGVLSYMTNKTKDGNDFVSKPGERTLLTSEGALRINEKDTIIAGTNLLESVDLIKEVLAKLGGSVGSIIGGLTNIGGTIMGGLTNLGGSGIGGLTKLFSSIVGSSKPDIVAQNATISPSKERILEDPAESTSFDDRGTEVTGTNSGGSGGLGKEVIDRLDRLIAEVVKGGNVYMDSNKVGMTLSRMNQTSS